MLIPTRLWLVPVKPLRLGHKPAELFFIAIVFFFGGGGVSSRNVKHLLPVSFLALSVQLGGKSDFSLILFNLLTAFARGNGGQLCSWLRTCARPSELKTRNIYKKLEKP